MEIIGTARHRSTDALAIVEGLPSPTKYMSIGLVHFLSKLPRVVFFSCPKQ